MISEGGYQPGAARETRSFLVRPLHPATVRKVLLWVGISLWLGISLFYLVDFLGLNVRKLWTSKLLLKAVGILVIFLLRRVAVRDAAVSRRRAKNESSPGSSSPIDPA